jgi:hypothetical protein
MKLEPDKVIAWLYQPSPEHISPEKLNKIRCNAWGSLPSLQDLQKEGRVNENFYVLLMKWLGLQTREEVDIWITSGFEEQSGPIDPSCRSSAHIQPAATTEQKVCQNGGS